jgi:protoheme IX farnesyltransferase
MSAVTSTVGDRLSLFDTFKLYYQMTRPRVLMLVLFTGLPALALGQKAWPGISTAVWVLIGTALSGAACSVLNAWIERDTDAQMARTRNRPLPAASIAPNQAVGLGIVLAIVSTAMLWWCGGPIAAAVGAGSILFYVFVYTLWLKPRTPQNIVIGGAAGATAPLIVDAAMDGELGLAGLILFLIIFLWTPPHFWAIALYRKEDYRNAGFPMMPLVVGDQGTRWRMLAYTLLLFPVTLWPVYLGFLGPIYGVTAVAVGLWFTWWNVRVIREKDYETDRGMFKASIVHLMTVFGAMLVDLAVSM